VQTGHGARATFTVAPEVMDGVRALARAEGATEFMVLLAAWQVLLHRWSGQDDFGVGTSIAGRTRRETEGVVGCFVNQLVLRSRLDGDPTFREALRRARATTLDAYARQDVPFERVVEALHPERSRAWAPLFQTTLVLTDVPGGRRELPGLQEEPLAKELATTKYDLGVLLTPGPDGLRGAVQYDPELFDPSTVARLLRRFSALLEGAAHDPDRRIAAMPLASAQERARLGTGFNAAFGAPPTP
jgi:non-ribosomal peptide synthetase component F